MVVSNGCRPDEEVLALARERGTAVVASPLDSYVTSRMITLSAPCRALMDAEPLVVRPDDLVADIAEMVKDVDYRAAVVVDGRRVPIGVVTRSDLVGPQPRRVLLVDHAEQAQSVIGIEEAEIVEILDHHHIGSIETHIPVRATFDPVGSTSTLVIERFRQAGMEPSRPAATLLLGAVLSDTVLLNSPTTTERDHAVVAYLEQILAIDATAFGREMFEQTSDLSRVAAEEIVARDAKAYEAGGADGRDRPGRDGRARARRPARRAAGRARRPPRARGPRADRADGHRHPRQGDRAVRVRRARGARRSRARRVELPA